MIPLADPNLSRLSEAADQLRTLEDSDLSPPGAIVTEEETGRMEAVLPDEVRTGRQRHRIDALDSVRGVAALVVVVHHCLLSLPRFCDYFFSRWHTRPQNLAEWLLFDTPLRVVWAGYEAVILFYVLSGLVLALPWVERRQPPYAVFAVKRIARIYAPYLVAVAGAALLSASLAFRRPIAGLSDWVNVMNWSHPVTPVVLLHHLFMTGRHNNLDGPIHSLVWEMRVSLLFPLIIVPMVARPVRGTASVLTVLFGTVGAILLVLWRHGASWSLLSGRSGLDLASKFAIELEWTAFFALFFVMGILIAFNIGLIRRWGSLMPRVLPVLCLLGGLLVIQGHWAHREIPQDLMVGAGSCLVIAAALLPGPIQDALARRSVRWLGEISYSLYLIHVPLLLLALITLSGTVPVWAILVATPPVSILAAWGFHRAVALPSVRLGQHLAAGLIARQAGPRSKRVTTSHSGAW